MSQDSCWWSKKWGKNKICGITHTRLRQGYDKSGFPYVIYLECNHGFYSKALYEWACLNDTCPICRKSFNFIYYILKYKLKKN
jgi:hypothetical protein